MEVILNEIKSCRDYQLQNTLYDMQETMRKCQCNTTELITRMIIELIRQEAKKRGLPLDDL